MSTRKTSIMAEASDWLSHSSTATIMLLKNKVASQSNHKQLIYQSMGSVHMILIDTVQTHDIYAI